LFEQYGKTIWNPLAEQNQIELKTFPGGPLVEFLPSVIEQVEKSKADIVYVSKPRLPSLIFGLLMRLRYGTPMIVDVDDHELSFFPNETPLSMDDAIKIAAKNPADAKMPYANVWTQLSEHLLQFADGITVSNIALQKRFGGVIVRHARDETTFSVSRARRSEVRKEFGLGEADVAIVFVGTPRPHKGIFRIAESLERLNDRRLVFVVVGSITDARTKNQFKKYKNARIKFFENQPWSRLPELVSMADLVAILQDPTSKISQFQIPAKLTDAMALGVPILATRVAPFADLFASDVLLAVDEDADLDGLLQSVSDVPTAFQAWARRARTLFISEFSYAVNSARIKLVAEEARNTELSSNDAIANTLAKLFDYAGVPFPYGGRSKVVASPAIKQGARRRDVVFFWKQNDSDIYGRRSDMLVKYLLRSEKVGRVVHFDHALTLSQLEATVDHSPHAPYHQGNLVYLNSVQRILKMADRGPIFRRTFLCRAGSAVQSFLGMELPPRSQYAEFVKQTLKECGIEECPIAWVWPVVFDFPTIHDHVKFDKVIVDIIDDQRKWNAKPEYMRRVEQNYVDVLKLADAVFVNCEPVREGFSDLRDDIVVVPNGAETFSSNADWQAPDDLARLPRPVIGYVGNLRDRIDFKLIDDLARRHPEWSIVLIGSAQGALEVFSVAERQNVHLLGVRRYEEAVRYIKNFDVAIMPHLDTELSQNMNPLKLYVYFSLGVPIVTTEVANIGDLHSHVAVAKTHDEFVAAVERAVRGEFAPLSDEKRSRVIGEVSWVARVNAILSRVGL
jgi:glycosyltransferase involved in cell wall biosynthesis